MLFLSQLLLAAWMGAEDFGIYSFAWACVAILGTLAGLGMPGTSVRFIAKYDAEGDPSRLRGLLRFCRVNTLLAAMITTLLAMAVVAAFPGESRYSDALCLSFLAIPFLAFLNLDAAFARGFNWMTRSAIAEQIARPAILILLGCLVVVFVTDPEAGHFVVACVVAYVIAWLVQHFWVRRAVGARVMPGERRVERSEWLAMSAGMLLLNGSQTIRLNTDPLLVGVMLQPADVAIYTAAMRTATLVSFVMMVAGVVAQPRISALHALRSDRELSRFLTATTRGVFLVSLAIGLLLAVAGRSILALFGPEFVAGYPVLLVLVAAHVLAASMGPLTSALVMTGRQAWAAAIHAAALPVSAVLSVALIALLGLIGAALAAAASLILTQVVLYLLVRRFRGVR
jgi:O-antigen/teichoic acid export membrane protein